MYSVTWCAWRLAHTHTSSLILYPIQDLQQTKDITKVWVNLMMTEVVKLSFLFESIWLVLAVVLIICSNDVIKHCKKKLRQNVLWILALPTILEVCNGYVRDIEIGIVFHRHHVLTFQWIKYHEMTKHLTFSVQSRATTIIKLILLIKIQNSIHGALAPIDCCVRNIPLSVRDLRVIKCYTINDCGVVVAWLWSVGGTTCLLSLWIRF